MPIRTHDHDVPTDPFPDGLEALRRELNLGQIMKLIERTARWVDPATFEYLPLWYPAYARREPFFKANWTEPQMNRNRQTGESVHKAEGNSFANKALTLALGLRPQERPNWSCCHIWGIDDSLYQTSNAVVQDRRFYSCVANMVLLPTPLKAFTDVMADVKMMLRVCSRHLYGWSCDHDEVESIAKQVDDWASWEHYPETWPTPNRASVPLGTVQFSGRIKKAADDRKAAIKNEIRTAGQHYPRKSVLDALNYWNITL